MENISYVGLSQQVALQQQMDMTANNLANASTPGYKSQNVLFTDYLNRSRGGDKVDQVYNYGSYRDLAPGAMAPTHNPFDVSINGKGFFSVQTPQGVRYTRDGGFQLNAQRELVNKSGYKVMGDGGPITIPEEATSVTITPEGVIATEDGEIGRIALTDFQNPQMMQRVGENLFDAKGAAQKPIEENTTVMQGSLEQSNVNPVLEMNKMIELLRMFQGMQRMVQNDHERIRTTIQKLTRV